MDFDGLAHQDQLNILLELADASLARYDLPPNCAVAMINLSENATYRIEAPDGRRWALRIHRDGYHSKTAIASELAWLVDLRNTGVVVTPRPIKGKDGELIQIVGHAAMGRPRHIVLSDWETGVEPGIGEDLEGPFEVLGEVTARMHLHTRQWQRPSWFQRHSWDFETSLGEDRPHWGRWRDGMGVDAERARLFGRTVDLIGRRLASCGKGHERFGLIHCDLRLANLLIDGKAVKVIDFDDCGFGWYMYDAATPVSFYEHEPQVPGLIEAWKKGYRRVIALAKEDEAEIPTFVMLRRLLLVAWIGSHHETDLARSMGLPYTQGTVGLCEEYLQKFS
ncbi:MAG: phosphotransferase enzyme family protein [Rhizobiales bacterium]|nr:phosphotransferase enzyme family protein [Hyphomicrobiales bacterium]MBI3674883.1 phosphotransferase enzyme family protein [Hyphomicrobiales bacterium]